MIDRTPRRLIETVAFSIRNSQSARPSDHQRRSYNLRILQQPVRARMCGFGDRDRRLLTPPVIVELLVHDSHSGARIDADEVDTSFFVLNADLWDSNCTQELNIVMHPVFCNPEYVANYPTAPGALIAGPSMRALPEGVISYPHHQTSSSSSESTKSSNEMAYTRNLIGALAQSASKLRGIDGQAGIFFIFHDLSIRTEGVFRFRFMFLALANDINNFRGSGEPADVLASIFSEPFQVYSAKKFPGMLGPTELTRHFTAQRVRIPTRTRRAKDGETEGTDENAEDDET